MATPASSSKGPGLVMDNIPKIVRVRVVKRSAEGVITSDQSLEFLDLRINGVDTVVTIPGADRHGDH